MNSLPQRALDIAEELKSLACIECVRGWIEKYKGTNSPQDDIKKCAELGLISDDLQKRLLNEVEIIINAKN